MGKAERAKGYRREAETVKLFRSWGLFAERVPLSGGTSYAKGDVDLYPAGFVKGVHAPLICEVKGRKKIPAYIREWLGHYDILIIHEDRQERLYVVSESTLRGMLTDEKSRPMEF